MEELKSKESQLIKALQDVDESLTYRYLGYNSLFRYCVEALCLTESQSMMYISVARKSKSLPSIQKALESGQVTVSKVSRVIPVINQENQSYWLELTQTSSKREVQKAVAKVNPKAIQHEKAKYLTDTVVELNIPVSEEVFHLIERVREMLIQKSGKSVSFGEVIQVLTEKYLEKEDPIRREKRRGLKNDKKQRESNAALSPCPGKVKKPEAISRTLRDKVITRDGGRCTFQMGSVTCNQTVFLQVHHLLPKEQGGKDTLENLSTLCAIHHRLVHGHFH